MIFFLRSLVITALALSAMPAVAQSARSLCGTYPQVTEVLEGQLGQVRSGWGLGPTNQLFEVYSSSETGTWAIIVTSPSVTTCLMAAGDFWNDASQPPGDDL